MKGKTVYVVLSQHAMTTDRVPVLQAVLTDERLAKGLCVLKNRDILDTNTNWFVLEGTIDECPEFAHLLEPRTQALEALEELG